MLLKALDSRDFRNLRPGRIVFGEGLNLLCGGNGAGKSNLLEAIYCVCTTRSFRGAAPSEMVRTGQPRFWVAAEIESSGTRHTLEVIQERGRREQRLDGKRIGLTEAIRRFPVLAFSSQMLEVVRGGPRDRRRFLDRGIVALRPGYLQELGEFHRVLLQRNRLLRRGAEGAEQRAWDERFAAAAAPILFARREFVGRLAAAVGLHGSDLLPAGLEVGLQYRPGSAIGEEDATIAAIAAAVLRELGRLAEGERRARHTLRGPHRDDLTILAAGREAGRYGSAGQQRSVLLALKVTRLELQREASSLLPLLLVDDLDAELDREASRRLLGRLAGLQAFGASCRWEGAAPPAFGERRFRVEAGAVEALDAARTAPGAAALDGTR